MTHLAAWEAVIDWRAIGEVRRAESQENQAWKVVRYWLKELDRVMPEFQKAPPGGKGHRLGSRLRLRDEPSADDYALLGLPPLPPPSAEAVAAAFRAKAMVWHPDHHAQLPEEKRASVTARFQELLDAHARLRRKHKRQY